MVFNGVLLSTAYFAPVQFYSFMVSASAVYVEQFENFQKQTYRNRCEILGSNGVTSLVVPVVKGRGKKIAIKDLKISYDEDWQRNHWRSIFSAYNSSPFFEFYKDELFPVFKKKRKYLFDLNLEINNILCDFLEIDNKVELTSDFEKVPAGTLNLREMISPKNKTKINRNFKASEYTQVFSGKFGFVANLSMLDLLFNEGPNSYTHLVRSMVQGFTF